MAFGKNPPFLPDSSVFKRIVSGIEADGGPFGIVDLYSAFLLQQATGVYGFGRGAEKQARRQTRFLFYMVVLELLKDVLSRESMPVDLRSVSTAMKNVLENAGARTALLDQAVEVIDRYFTQGGDDSVFAEPAYVNSFNTDLNAFLKWERLGKSDADTPRLHSGLAINKSVMGRPVAGQPSPRKTILAALPTA
jgi:hypothetical protein